MNKSNIVFSEQGLIDCDVASSGCSGGHPFDGIKYAINAGVTANESYPYIAADVSWTKIVISMSQTFVLISQQTCGITDSMPMTYPNQACYQDLKGNETLLKIQLIRFGPIATAIC